MLHIQPEVAAQAAAISFVATLVVNLVMPRSIKEFLRHSVAGVSLGTLAFSWGVSKNWAESDLIVLTALSAGYVDVAVKFGHRHIPVIIKIIFERYGIRQSNVGVTDSDNPDRKE